MYTVVPFFLLSLYLSLQSETISGTENMFKCLFAFEQFSFTLPRVYNFSCPNPKSQSKVFLIYLNVEELILVVVSKRTKISDLYGGTTDS